MILRLVVPEYSKMVEAARVQDWHVDEGDRVFPGDPVCDLHVERLTTMRRPHSANRILALDTSPPEVEFGSTEVDVTIRVVAMDIGFLQRILAREEQLSVGQTLALFTVEEDEPVTEGAAELEEAPEFRVTVDTLDPE